MCEFCENNRTEKDIYSDKIQRWFMRILSDGKWYLFYRHKEFLGAKGIEINNCPICGKKLSENTQTDKKIDEIMMPYKDRFSSEEEFEHVKNLCVKVLDALVDLWNALTGGMGNGSC